MIDLCSVPQYNVSGCLDAYIPLHYLVSVNHELVQYMEEDGRLGPWVDHSTIAYTYPVIP